MKLPLPHFELAKVLVIGDVMLDRYWHGATLRISPEAPVPVVKVDQFEDRAGGAGNVALNVAKLGSKVYLIGATGNDESANILSDRMEAAGVSCDFARLQNVPTITKLRIISQNQQLIRIDHEESFDCLNLSIIEEKVSKQIVNIDTIVLSDYNKGTLKGCQQLIQQARNKNIPILVDPKGTDFESYRGATLITPNLNEFEAVVGHCANEHELSTKGQQLLKDLELSSILITRSEQGMTLIQRKEPTIHLPARAREVFDVTGAGDTVIAVLAAALGAGEEIPQAAALANIAAGIVVGKLGTASISISELRKEVHRECDIKRGPVTLKQLLAVVENARAHGEKIVFTNGCFDIIHAGHVSYLKQARQRGDRLILAINSDASVTRLKGSERPINSLEERISVLAGLEDVDWIISFDEDTPENLLRLIKPDVLVKGADYSPDKVVGASIVHQYGGEVKTLTFVENCSTTGIVEKIRKEKKDTA